MKKFFLILSIVLVTLGVGGFFAWRYVGPFIFSRFFGGGGGLPAIGTSNPLEKLPDVNPATKTNPFQEVKTNPFE